MRPTIPILILIALAIVSLVSTYYFINKIVLSSQKQTSGTLWNIMETATFYVENVKLKDFGTPLVFVFHDFPCGYVYTSYNGHYYEKIDIGGCRDNITNTFDYFNFTWNFAYNFCKNRGGYLVIVNDSFEEKFLIKLCGHRCWIGLYQDPDDLSDNSGIPEGCDNTVCLEPNGSWKWVNGVIASDPDGTTWFTYVNWGIGEPNNWGKEDCSEIWGDYWNDLKCFSEESFICEYEKDVGSILLKNGNLPYFVYGNEELGYGLFFFGDDYLILNNNTFLKFPANSSFTVIIFLNLSERLFLKGEAGILKVGDGWKNGWTLFWKDDSGWLYWRNGDKIDANDLTTAISIKPYCLNKICMITAIWDNHWKYLLINSSTGSISNSTYTNLGITYRDVDVPVIASKESIYQAMRGVIYEIFIYSRRLSIKEIDACYLDVDNCPRDDSLVLHLAFEERNGTKTADLSKIKDKILIKLFRKYGSPNPDKYNPYFYFKIFLVNPTNKPIDLSNIILTIKDSSGNILCSGNLWENYFVVPKERYIHSSSIYLYVFPKVDCISKIRNQKGKIFLFFCTPVGYCIKKEVIP